LKQGPVMWEATSETPDSWQMCQFVKEQREKGKVPDLDFWFNTYIDVPEMCFWSFLTGYEGWYANETCEESGTSCDMNTRSRLG
jgi:hypothetical protein